MQDTKPFIDMGWHTIGLGGELKRLPNGKKTIPIFGKDWLERAIKEQNQLPTPLGGAITGKESNIVAIDCDNTITYSMFKALDPDYNFHFISNGKKDLEGNLQFCGTIVYEYDEAFSQSFKVTKNGLALDFLSSGRMIFLPTDANETKEPITAVPQLKPIPPEVAILIQALHSGTLVQAPLVASNVSSHKFNLAPQVDMFIRSNTVTKSLFRVLTPKDFRETDAYIEHGYLHPDSVEEGRGSEYLSKVSAILGADISIDVTMYMKAMTCINDEFAYPMTGKRLAKTIVEPMCEGHATNDAGEAIWKEDPNWSDATLTFITKYDALIHIFYDYHRTMYYVVSIADEKVQMFDSLNRLNNHLGSISIEPMTMPELKASIPNILAGAIPERLFGFYHDEAEQFNTFVSTPAYKVFKNPTEYMPYYKYPATTLKFLETLIPDPTMKNYLLGFLRRKLDTFEHSPVILYFLGVPGSGKDTFVNMLRDILGRSSIEKPTAQMFLEKNNAWIMDKLFIQLDEYGDQLATWKDKTTALGLLKQYTGESQISIRMMREDIFTIDHRATFVMTANSNPLMLDADDRRIALFDCPNPLLKTEWLYGAGGIEAVIKALHDEISDFCYYLSTEVTNLDGKAYQTPPASKNKDELIANSMPIAKRLAHYIETKNWVALKPVFYLHGPYDMLKRAKSGILLEPDLVETYESMRGGDINDNSNNIVRNAMKEAGFTPNRTTIRGNNHGYMYKIPGLYQILNVKTEIIDEDDM